ncbi:MAG: nickel-responsive transcriptional regulator NikR [Kiritimatiellae bacterium]|nr:nickel-responsive transcriptional regulator NikR [Kiritimatiellia bacterium]MDD3545040.1 nickel-responsive transcriptional regulator NikR [Kiritimatiellia bacterium]MDD4024352.1 nickel-responsive transcriptional regulator NikR [Kiritimatiellia bacterium]MDD4623545.1 nickel-responsive transcriptional regulator NikR [Kiritimatiellia bacterium]
MKNKLKTRFSVSMTPDLADALDTLVSSKGFPSRSQAIAEILRAHLAAAGAENPDTRIAGTITLVYDHHKRNLTATLTDIQHDYHEMICSVLHVHVDHHVCMEVLAVRGRSGLIRELSDRLITTKGVQHGRLAVTRIG